MPSTPFIGVRISWLVLAMNCPRASEAERARSRARCSCSSMDFCADTSV